MKKIISLVLSFVITISCAFGLSVNAVAEKSESLDEYAKMLSDYFNESSIDNISALYSENSKSENTSDFTTEFAENLSSGEIFLQKIEAPLTSAGSILADRDIELAFELLYNHIMSKGKSKIDDDGNTIISVDDKNILVGKLSEDLYILSDQLTVQYEPLKNKYDFFYIFTLQTSNNSIGTFAISIFVSEEDIKNKNLLNVDFISSVSNSTYLTMSYVSPSTYLVRSPLDVVAVLPNDNNRTVLINLNTELFVYALCVWDNYLKNNVKITMGNLGFTLCSDPAKFFSITYNANGGTNAPGRQILSSISFDNTITSQKPTREHYLFLGWSTSKTASSATYFANSSYYPLSDTTFYAVWKYVGHNGGQATCTERAICSECGEAYGEPLGHTYSTVVTSPTCVQKGYTTHTCKCGETFVDSYVDPLGHSFTKYVHNNDATLDSDGTETAKCDRCNATNTRTAVGSKLVVSTKIRNMSKYNGKTVDYRSSITFYADIDNGILLDWVVIGADYTKNADGSCTVNQAKGDFTIYNQAMDKNRTIVNSETETVKVKHGFFDKLKAFFVLLFNKNAYSFIQ